MTDPITEPTDHLATRSRPPLTLFTIVAILAPGLIVFALPALSLIARNEDYFGSDYTAGRFLYTVAMIVIVVGFALWALSATPGGRFLFTCYVLITPGWFLYSTLLGWRRAIGGVIVAALVLAAGFLAARSRSSQIGTIGVIGAVLLAGTILTTVIDARPAEGAATSTGTQMSVDAARLSSTSLPNVYHIVFDEFQTEMIEATLNAGVKQALAGFVYYPDARTQWGRTQMSMASIFAPARYDYQTTPQEFVDSSLRGVDSSLEHLRQAGYRITTYTISNSVYGSPQPFDQTVLFKDFVQSNPGSNYAQIAISLWMYSNLPGSFARRLISEDDYDQFTGQNLLPDDAPPVSAEGFRTFINRERQLPATGRYSLVHLLLPHFPYVLSADCEYEPGLDTTPSEQAACATTLIVHFVEELRALGRYTNSTIIIHGDHGAGFELTEEGELDPVPSDYFGERWSDARSRSLLLVKPTGVDSSEEFRFSNYPAELTDVMPTVFDSVGLPFELTDGRSSLLGTNLPDRPVRHYHFYNKGEDNLPDGEVVRFEIIDGVLTSDTTIRLPMP